MPNPDVFCEDCVFYEDRDGKDVCHKRTGKKKTPIKEVAKKSDPHFLNKNNHCNHYEEL